MKSAVNGLAVRATVVFFISFLLASCGVYSFSEKGNIDPEVKTVKINTVENRAPYVNPQLSPNLSDRIRQKVSSQTKLTITNGEGADWEISARVEDYSVTTTGVTTTNGQQQSSINRLNVRVHVTLNKRIKDKIEEYDVSRSFDFSARQSLQQAESTLLDEMIRNLTDEIFNKLFSDW